jgi:hypothetical protein
MMTASPSTLVTSWTTTQSTPCGSTAPVMILTVSPAPTLPSKARPAKAVPMFFRRVSRVTGGEVVEAQRPAVHGRVVVAGHVDRRDDVFGQHAVQRLAHEDALDGR